MRRMLCSDGDPTPRERLDDPPAPADRPAAALIVGTVVAFSLLGVLAGGFFHLPLWGPGLLAVAAGLAVALGSPAARHVTLLCLLAAVAYRARVFGLHPFPLLSALLGYGVIVVASPPLRETVGWLHSGSFEPRVRRLVALGVAASVLALPFWRLLARPDVVGAQELLLDVPWWALPAIGLMFAAVNAGVEEAAFRGVVLDALRSSVGIETALVVQAAAFGLVHYAHGVPSGASGALMSGVYGFALGVIRLRSRGLLAPWVAHAATDLAIFVLLVGWR